MKYKNFYCWAYAIFLIKISTFEEIENKYWTL